MRRSGVAAPLRMLGEEIPDPAATAQLIAADLTAMRIVLDRLSEHVLMLRPDYRWQDDE